MFMLHRFCSCGIVIKFGSGKVSGLGMIVELQTFEFKGARATWRPKSGEASSRCAF